MKNFKRKYSKAAAHYKDADYLSKLSADELMFLDAFNDAEFGANTKRLEKITTVTPKLKKEFYDQHNARRRDISSVTPTTEYIETGMEPTVAETTMADISSGIKKLNGKKRNAFRKN